MSELPSVDTIVSYLNQALTELEETNDYLSYATLIDVHLSNPSRFRTAEKIVLLTEFNRICFEHPDIVYEIGWDFPELVLSYTEGEWGHSSLRESLVLVLVMRSFEIYAKTGNPKEIYIKVIEMLGAFKFPDGKEKNAELFFKMDANCDVQIHMLMELLSSSLKRINTIYPSNFLGMALGSILKLTTRYCQYSTQHRFMIRRAYIFVRDYIPPLKPLNYLTEYNLTEEEAKKIDDDENYLQRLLLQSFITHIYSITTQRYSLFLSFKNYRNLQLTKKGQLPIDYNKDVEESAVSTYAVYLRFLTLASSYDLELSEEFQKLQDDSLELFKKIDEKKSDDDKIQDLIKFSINDWISNLYHPESKTIPRSSGGLLILCSQYFYEESQSPIDTHKLILLTIRFLSPGLISEKFRNFGIIDALLYLNWVNIADSSKREDYQKIPKYQINLYLQSIIFYSSITNNPSLGLIAYTLLTKLLTLITEENSYEFIIDTLTSAPFQNAKMALITILKDLILRHRSNEENNDQVDDLTNKLAHTKLETTESSLTDTEDSRSGSQSTITLPPLPKRAFITLNKSRVEDIYALVRESIDETFPESNEFDQTAAKLTLGYVNLLIGIRKLYPIKEQTEIVKILDSKLIKHEKNEDNILQLVRLANESLKSFLDD